MIYLLGDILSKLFPFILLPYFTRVLGADGYGELSLYQSFFAFIAIFVGLSSEGAVARYFYFYGKRSIRYPIIASYLYISFVAIALISIFLLLSRQELVIVVFATWTYALLNIQLVIKQCAREPVKFIILQLLMSALSTLLTVLVFSFVDTKPIYRFLMMGVSNGIVVIIALVFFPTSKYKRVNFKNTKLSIGFILSFGFPLIFHQISIYMKGQMDRFLLFFYFEPKDIGIYSASYQLASLFLVVLLAINKAVVPIYYSALKNQSITIDKIFSLAKLSLLIVPVPALFCLLMPEYFYSLIFGKEFGSTKVMISMFVLGVSLMLPYFIMINYFFYFGKNFLISKITISSSFAHILFVFIFCNISISLVPFSLILSNLFMVGTLMYVSHKETCRSNDENK
ncbi:oligosaccharide flippase family protein [Vibrio parahaemolyticus]